MPQAAPKPCTAPGCGVLVRDGTSRCSKHPPQGRFADRKRGSRHERGYGTAWDKLRQMILRRDMHLCQPCWKVGDVAPGAIVDHIIPKSSGGTDDYANLQTICRRCHAAKTADEARRGRGC